MPKDWLCAKLYGVLSPRAKLSHCCKPPQRATRASRALLARETPVARRARKRDAGNRHAVNTLPSTLGIGPIGTESFELQVCIRQCRTLVDHIFLRDACLCCENFCTLQGSFGRFGPKVSKRVRKRFLRLRGGGARRPRICEVAGLLEAPKPPKNQSRRKIGQK